jgi:hypothetical protein
MILYGYMVINYKLIFEFILISKEVLSTWMGYI